MLNPPPPRDAQGRVIPHDHVNIRNEDFLVRGIPAAQIINGRISSGAFNSSTKNDPYFGLSVDLESLAGISPIQNFACSVKFQTSVARNLKLLIGYDPISNPAEGINLAHCGIWRIETGGSARLSKGQSKTLHRNAIWHKQIPGVKIHK